MYTGAVGGSYDKQANRLLQQMSGKHTLSNESGSLSILSKVDSDENGVGLSQLDALALYNSDNPSNDVKLLGVLNSECAMVIVNKDSNIEDEDDLEVKGVKIGVGTKGSGAEATLHYMGKLDSDYANIEMVYDDPDLIIAQLSGGVSDVDGFMYVSSPSLDNPYAKLVADPANNLKFVALDDYDMNDKIDGKQVYTFQDVPVKEGLFSDHTVEAPCTKVAVVANKNNKDIGSVAKVIVRNRASLTNLD
ncbi:hypothetical protein N9043_00605 [bacterium]|nr:hypothetical protein [bacterium]